ncbi:MAG TPA: Rid family detoxifying hydrolase [Vicinamibacterales bacterium]|nr:Rid family detoxifying hydrolase [Vicinamibacterales bacterium]
MTDTAKCVLVPGAPAPVGPYSSAVIVGGLVFVSGQSGRDPATDQVSEDVEIQTEVCLKNIEIILAAAGSSLSKVVRCGVFLVDMKDFKKMNGVYARLFGGHRPARTTVAVSALPGPGLRVEIDAVATL